MVFSSLFSISGLVLYMIYLFIHLSSTRKSH
uniref:Uncharacterized protein n=1 Tax=Anguilla anguilla TaxID=7936 RepID=A0A0E9Q570_ANGAN